LDPGKVALCLENVERLLSARIERPVSYLSVRDLFARHTEREYAEAQDLFEIASMIEPVHRDIEDVRQHLDGGKARQAKHGGLFPEGLSLAELRLATSTMEEIRAVGAEVIDAGLTRSPMHIVISCWLQTQLPWMVVTATDSDKSRLLLFVETPVVTERDDAFIYYGDPSRLPSSEAVPHWFIHNDLRAASRDAWRCLLHIHSDPLNDLAESGDIRLEGDIFLPTLPHIEYGSERMGHMLAEVMIRNEVAAATVKNHGQWFVARSFEAALRQAVRAHEAAVEKLRDVAQRG
jgi:hypothetical protein